MDNNLAIGQDHLTPSHEYHLSPNGKKKDSVLSRICDVCNIDAFDLDAFPAYADQKEGGYTLLNKTDKIKDYLDIGQDGIISLWPVTNSFVFCNPPILDRVLQRDVKTIYETFSKVLNIEIEPSPNLYTIQHSVFLKAAIEYRLQGNTTAILLNQGHAAVKMFQQCYSIAKSLCDTKVFMPNRTISMVTMLGLHNKVAPKHYNLYVIGDISNVKTGNEYWYEA